jgi:hypothetical protein
VTSPQKGKNWTIRGIAAELNINKNTVLKTQPNFL